MAGRDGLLWQQHLRASERDGRVAGVSDPTGQMETPGVDFPSFSTWLDSRVAGLAEILEGCCLLYSASKKPPYGETVTALLLGQVYTILGMTGKWACQVSANPG
jgi:hypothetical protein